MNHLAFGVIHAVKFTIDARVDRHVFSGATRAQAGEINRMFTQNRAFAATTGTDASAHFFPSSRSHAAHKANNHRDQRHDQ